MRRPRLCKGLCYNARNKKNDFAVKGKLNGMKRLWPYLILALLHFVAVAMTAFAVHYSNGINVRGFKGEYGFWMEIGNAGNRIIAFTRWAIPVVLIVALFFMRKKKKEAILICVGVVSIIMATWPLYNGLIDFWERNWISG